MTATVEPSRPSDWPYHFEVADQAFELDADTKGIRLYCVGCMDPLNPYEYGFSGRTSVNMMILHNFMRGHIAVVHPAWTVAS